MPRQFGTIAKEILRRLTTQPRSVGLDGKSPYPMLNLSRELFGDSWPTHEIQQRKKLSQALWRLKKDRLIITSQKQDGTFVVELTEKGKRKVREFQFADLVIKIPKKWDGIWRIVVFDIPNKRNAGREALRNKIKELDFYQLQKSVWAFPSPCEAEIEFITELFRLYPYVQIIEATKIKSDAKLRKYYGLF
jgi:DNA-binding transcriptional regulator PaaX